METNNALKKRVAAFQSTLIIPDRNSFWKMFFYDFSEDRVHEVIENLRLKELPSNSQPQREHNNRDSSKFNALFLTKHLMATYF